MDMTRVDIAGTLGAVEIAEGRAQQPSPNQAEAVWAQFSDGATVPPGVAQDASLAVSLGFMKGYPDGTFGPERDVTRAEVAVLLDRVLRSSAVMGSGGASGCGTVAGATYGCTVSGSTYGASGAPVNYTLGQ
jgi:hypothetical protein